MSGRKEALQLKEKLEREGFSVLLNGSGHWEVRPGPGERKITTFPQTPGDHRWKLNAMSYIRAWKRQCAAAAGGQPGPGRA